MTKVRITVLKITFDESIAKQYAMDTVGPCKAFHEGDVFLGGVKKPDGFCDTAWKCISQYVFALANGGGRDGFFFNDWVKEPGVAISCCNDGLRPVIFKIEATDIPDSL